MLLLLSLGCYYLSADQLAERLGEGADTGADGTDTGTDTAVDSGDDCGSVGDVDADGFESEACGGEDCDDGDADVHPDAIEMCNETDDDCDGAVDDEPTDGVVTFADLDGDGFGNPDAGLWECTPSAGRVLDKSDCNDADPETYPGAEELCDGVLNDCDGQVDGEFRVPELYESLAAAVAAAIDSGEEGALVCLGAGSFASEVELSAGSIHLAGQGPELTTLDAYGGLRPLSITSADARHTISGLTLTGGTNSFGAGAYIAGEHTRLEDVHITDNHCSFADCLGSGLYLLNGQVDLVNVRVEENTAESTLTAQGVGIFAAGITGEWVNVVLAENSATLTTNTSASANGGGLSLNGSELSISGLEVRGNEIYNDGRGGTAASGIGIASIDSVLVVEDAVFHGNSAIGGETGSLRGGALYVYGGSAYLSQTDIRGGAFTAGAMVGTALDLNVHAEVALENCVVAGNYVDADSGAYGTVAVDAESTLYAAQVDLSGNVLSGGVAVGGGVFLAEGGRAFFHNSTIAYNALAAAVGAGGAVYSDAPAFDMTDLGLDYTNVYGNSATELQLATTVNGWPTMIKEDPAYEDTSDTDPLDWDLHLQPGSPLINAGDPSVQDADGGPSDVGAYGGPAGAW